MCVSFQVQAPSMVWHVLIDVECACTPQCLEWEAAVLRSIAGMHVTKRVCVQLVMHSYQGVFVPVVCVMADLIL